VAAWGFEHEGEVETLEAFLIKRWLNEALSTRRSCDHRTHFSSIAG
jgi:hypothetical protein